MVCPNGEISQQELKIDIVFTLHYVKKVSKSTKVIYHLTTLIFAIKIQQKKLSKLPITAKISKEIINSPSHPYITKKKLRIYLHI